MHHFPYTICLLIVSALLGCASEDGSADTAADISRRNSAFASAFSTNLPIVLVDTFGKKVKDEPKTPAMLSIIDNGPGRRNNLTDPANHFHGRVEIEIRGQSTRRCPKNQYGFATREESGKDKPVSLLGLSAESDWILHPAYLDKSLMRDQIAYWISDLMGHWAPATRYVEAFIDEEGGGDITDQYWGIYILMEKIKRGKSKVDIAKLKPNQTEESEISGGYLLNLDFLHHDKKRDCIAYPVTKEAVVCLHLVYPRYRKAADRQKKWITDYMKQFERALSGPMFSDPSAGYGKYIDAASFADFMLLNELLRNEDGYMRSAYMYKDRGKKFEMGPFWDCNICMGHRTGKTSGWVLDFLEETKPGYVPFWWKRLLEDDSFTGFLTKRWRELRKRTITVSKIEDKIDDTASMLEEAQERNFKRWPLIGIWNNFWYRPVPASWKLELVNLKRWFAGRIEWIDGNIDSLAKRNKTSPARQAM